MRGLAGDEEIFAAVPGGTPAGPAGSRPRVSVGEVPRAAADVAPATVRPEHAAARPDTGVPQPRLSQAVSAGDPLVGNSQGGDMPAAIAPAPTADPIAPFAAAPAIAAVATGPWLAVLECALSEPLPGDAVAADPRPGVAAAGWEAIDRWFGGAQTEADEALTVGAAPRREGLLGAADNPFLAIARDPLAGRTGDGALRRFEGLAEGLRSIA